MRDHIAPKSIDLRPPRHCIHVQTFGSCGKDVPDGAPVALCMGHLAAVWDYCQTRITQERLATAEQEAVERKQRSLDLFFEGLEEKLAVQREIAADPEVDDPESVVYYIRFGDRIKIGYSRNLGQRLTELPYDELLAVEPGANRVESRRHEQFRVDHIRGEWFACSPALLAHIEDVRAKQAERMRWTDKVDEARTLDDEFLIHRHGKEVLGNLL